MLNDMFADELEMRPGKRVKRLAGIDITRTVSMKRVPGRGKLAVTHFSWVGSNGRRRRIDQCSGRQRTSAK
jgi:hypothetical protein